MSSEVVAAVTGRAVAAPATIDLRAEIASRARRLGVRRITIDEACTRCDNARFFSHRAGDRGRQVAAIVARG